MTADSPFIKIENVTKRFGDVVAVNDVSLEIVRGELFSILGGSGCGKTTLLRILAGFEQPDAGRLYIDGVDITELPPYLRPVNMMFQSYALFPHMTVEGNVSYGLRKEGVAKAEIAERVQKILQLVQLDGYDDRRPDQLSGGQQQRVALARSLIKQPKVLLLDEPLAALDKKLREQTQFELMNIQEELGVTFVVVTHDQEEAMILSSRIAVMEAGQFEQVGEPKEVYEFPRNRFVADFVGTINIFEGSVESCDENLVRVAVEGEQTLLNCAADEKVSVGNKVGVAIRPEKIFISKSPPDDGDSVTLKGVVQDLGYFGNISLYRVKLGNGKIVQASAQNRQRSSVRAVDWDDEVYISWQPASAALLLD